MLQFLLLLEKNVSTHGDSESQFIQVLSSVLMLSLQIVPTGKKMPIHTSTTVVLEEDISSIVKQRRYVDAVMVQMLLIH
jgi:hypothetical protein